MSVGFTFELPEKQDEFDLMFADVISTIEMESLDGQYSKKTDKLIKDLDKKMDKWREYTEEFGPDMKEKLAALKKAKNPTLDSKAVTYFIHYQEKDYLEVGREALNITEDTTEAVKDTEQDVNNLTTGKITPKDLRGGRGLAITRPYLKITRLTKDIIGPFARGAYSRGAVWEEGGIDVRIIEKSLDTGVKMTSQLERLFNVLDKMIRKMSVELVKAAEKESVDKKALALSLEGLKIAVRSTNKLTKEIYLLYSESNKNLFNEIEGV